MNFYDVLHAIKNHKGELYDLSTGSPQLISEISNIIVKTLIDIAKHPDTGQDLGSYRNLDGLPRLIKAFADRCTNDFGHPIATEQVIVTPGVQAALRYIHEFIRQQGCRILYPLGLEFIGAIDPLSDHPPAIGQYVSSAKGMGTSKISFDPTSLDWQNVGAVILSHPHNPTGRLWSTDELKILASTAERNDAWLVLDETYALPFAPLITGGNTQMDASNVIHLYSFSKVGLAAERVGIVVAPIEITDILRDIQRRSIIQSPKLGQHLALALLEIFENDPHLASCFGRLYRERWELCRVVMQRGKILNKHLRIAEWEGGPFLWCEWEGLPASETIFWDLLDAGVAVTPAAALRVDPSCQDEPQPTGIRIGLGAPIENLERGVEIIARCLADLIP